MNKITNILKNSFAGINRFLTPGYELEITAADIDEAAFHRVKDIIRDNCFIFVIDRDNVHRDAIISEYARKRKYLISLVLIHTKTVYPERRLNLIIRISNEYKGSKAGIKTDIDGLGEILFKELSQFAGKDKLKKKSYRTPIPME